jgi:hypothetical protein
MDFVSIFSHVTLDMKFFTSVLSIILIDLVLAGDNAVIIAMNRHFSVPTLDLKTAGDTIVLHGIVHNPKEKEEIEKEAKKLAGDAPIEFELHYRGFLRSVI